MGVGAPWSRGSAGTGHAKDGCTHLAPPLDTDRPTRCRLRPRLGHPQGSRNPFITPLPPRTPISESKSDPGVTVGTPISESQSDLGVTLGTPITESASQDGGYG